MSTCVNELEKAPATYKIPIYTPLRQTRHGQALSLDPKYEQRTLCSGSIIVVPRNLVNKPLREVAEY